MAKRTCLGLGVLGLVLSSSCSGPKVRILNQPVAPTNAERVLVSQRGPSEGTELILEVEELEKLYRKKPDQALSELARRWSEAPTSARQLALAELCFRRADQLVRRKRTQALGRYLDVLKLTEDAAAVISDPRPQEAKLAKTLYDSSAEQVARILHEANSLELTGMGVLQNYQVGVAKGDDFPDLRQFDILVPADWLDTDDLELAQIQEAGFGAPMVGRMLQTPELKALEPNMPETGFALPLNARVEFSGPQATLYLQDLMLKSRATWKGKDVRLAGNYTAALSLLYFDRKRESHKIKATLRPAEYRSELGLFSIEPHREGKIPLVIVHGLLSSAETWLAFANLMRADPMVRENYQMLFFNYPSGNPIQYSATELRTYLGAYLAHHDPKSNNPNMENLVMLGHSMGGVLTSLQVRDSKDELEKLLFEVPIEELDVSEEERAQFASRLRFEANEDIGRTIFIAAPHRGSDMAANPIGQIGSWLIRLPFDLVDSLLGEVVVVDALTDVAQGMFKRPMNSVTSLRPDNPLLEATLELPVETGVQMHSIIARKDPGDPLLESSDGIVPYTSAHLNEVESELLVENESHRSVVETPECVAEVRRILAEHLKEH